MDYSYENERCTWAPSFMVQWDRYVFISKSIIPVTVLTICNVIIIYKLRKSRSFREKGMSESKKNDSVTLMLLSINIFYLFANLPHDLTYAYFHIYKLERTAEIFLYATIFHLNNMNFSVNFFLYFLSGSNFRTELFSLFKRGRLTLSKVDS